MSNQRYSVTIDVGADITKARAAMADLQKIFNTQNLGAGQSNKITSMFSDLSKALDELESKSGKTFSSLGEIKGIDKTKDRVSNLISDIAREFTKLEGMGDTELGKNFKGLADNLEKAGAAFKTYEGAISKIKSRQNDLSKYIEKTTKEYEKQKEVQKEYRDFRKSLPEDLKGKQQSGIRSYLTNQLEIARKENEQRQKELDDYINQKGYGDNVILTSGARKGLVRKGESYSEDKTLESLATNANEAQKALDGCTKSLNNFNNITKNLKSESEFKQIGDSLKQAKEELANLTSGKLSEEAFNNLKTSLGQIFGEDLFKDIQNSENAVEQFKEKINSISADKLSGLKQQFPEITSLIEQMGEAGQTAGQKINKGFSEMSSATQMEKEIDALGSRLKYFFSLAGGFNLMRRAIRSAVTTTKELDAVMTQTAVVSQYTVGDMWKTLPQYSKEAKKLGAAIKDVYSAQTLYVQQGLNMNDAMDLGVETLKMARVAGINAEEATNSMTAALRGFNMELNESSAVRINDVYSKLAQNTASNVQEISTAMTKTAALANSANMSFENTAAFLATIIESTREGAETAGTALKTVIARFTEVKKLYDEGELTGTDEEGQEVDVNKISKALRTAGINMNDFFTGAKGLDEIFIELGSKWDSLTTVQQRYIATMAAGSRQQSRFLALMQNYNRTLQLSNMAYNSAGSGQEQFEKTLDSLEAKLNKLKDSWDTFIMGIANSDLIKGAIDFGTNFLDILNNIVNAISGSNGLIKSITSIGLAIGGFKIGRALLGGGGVLNSIISGKGIKIGEQFGKTWTKGLGYALTKQAREEGKGLGNWAYQNFKFNKVDYLDGITKDNADKVKQAYEDYNNQRQAYQDLWTSAEKRGQQTFNKEKIESNLKQQFQEKSGLNEKQTQAVIDNKGIQETTKDYNALGNTVLALGGAFVALGAAIDGIAGKSTKAGSVLKGLGSGAMIAGTALKGAAAAAELFGASMATALGVVGIAIGVIAAVASIYDAFTESSEEKTERLRSQMEQSQQNLEDLQSKYDTLNSSIDTISEKEDAFDGLIKGTEEWNNAVQDLNNSIKAVIKQYPELISGVTFDENGVMHISQESIASAKQSYSEQIKAAKAGNIAANLSYKEQVRQNEKQNIIDTFGLEHPGGFGGARSVYLGRTTLDNLFGLNQQKEQKVFSQILDKIESGLYDFSNDSAEQIYEKLTEEEQAFYEANKSKVNKILIGYSKLQSFEEESANDFINEIAEDRIEIVNTFFGQESGGIQKAALNGTKQAQNKYKEFLNSINKDQIEASRTEAAQAYGYTNKNGKWVNTQGEPIKDEDVKKYIATKNTMDWLDKAAKNSQDWLSGQSQDVKNFISGQGARNLQLSKQDIDNWQQQNADNLLFNYEEVALQREQAFNQIDQQLLNSLVSQDTLNEVDNTLNEVDKQIREAKTYGAVVGLSKKRDQLAKPIIDQKKEFAEAFGNLDQQSYGKLATFISDASKNYGITAANDLYNNFKENLAGRTDADEIVNALFDEIDWSSITGVQDVIQTLQNLGYSIGFADEGFNSLIKNLIETQKVLKTFNLNGLKEEAKKALDLSDSIKSSSTGTFDEDTYKQMLKYGVSSSQFMYTGQGYTYTGGSLEQLGDQVAGYLTTATSDTISNLEKQIEQGKLINDKKISKDLKTAEDIRNSGITELYNKTTGLFLNLSEIATDEQLVQLYNEAVESANNIAGLEDQIKSIEAYAPYWDKTNDQVRGMGGTEQAQIAAAKVDAAKAGFDIQEVDAYAQSLANVSENLKDVEGNANAMAYAIAYDNMLMQQGIEQLSSNFDTWNQYLDNPNIPEYGQAINGLRDSLQKITGTNYEFSESFLKSTETLDLFAKAAKGDVKALADLKKAAAKDFINLNISDKNLADQVNNAIDGLDLENVEVGVELDKNVADIFQGLLEAGQLSAEQIGQAYENINYETPEIGTERIQVGSDLTTTADGYTDFTDVNGIRHHVQNASVNNVNGQQFIDVPVIGGSSTAKNAGSSLKGGVSKGGTRTTASPKKSGGGGGGGGKEFKNDFDKYYNQVEDINELERQRNLLEKDYDQLLKSESKSGKDIYDNLKQQLKLLEERRKLTADLAEKRKQQIIDTTKDEEFKSVSKYAWWNESDLTIEIDWDAINKIKNSEEGDLVKEYVKKLEDFQGKYDDMIEQLEDIESTVQEIKERGQKEYQSLEDRTRDALIKQIQDEIDELTDVDQAIKDANQRLFDSISQTLELQRQERSNAKTEEELSDKEKRLAYLQQDSSNANQVEIARLQKEIDDARQDYTDNLIDQKISELQRQNDEAADQRQQQIDLMQHSLDWQEKSGAFWQEAYRLISEGTDATGALVRESALEQLLRQGEAWDSLSEEGKMAWLEELEDLVSQGFAYLEMGRQLEDIGTKAGSSITFTNANGQKLTGTVDKNGNVVVKNSDGSTTTYKDVFQDYSGAFRTFETEGEAKAAPKPTTGTSKPSTGGTGSTTTSTDTWGPWYWNYNDTKHWKERKSSSGKIGKMKEEDHNFDVAGNCICGYKKRRTGGGGGGGGRQSVVMRYATGGLNTKSGMAWLDGTASNPELVLNARDTENFIQLKDTLASIKSGGGFSLTGGDNYYDIKVQVDSLSSDYDVDRAIDRIKARIAQDGAYRNVNTLSRLR